MSGLRLASLLSAGLMAALAGGCAPLGIEFGGGREAPAQKEDRRPDPAEVRLADAAERAEAALTALARISAAEAGPPAPGLPAEVPGRSPLPAALRRAVTLDWIGPVETLAGTLAATPDGRLVPLTPLDEPIMSDAALKNWTVAAVTEAFTLGHHDWRLRLSSVRENFTDEGYESFLAGLNESLFLDRLRDNLQVASAVAQGAPVVTETRHFQGRVGWAIEFPLLVTFAAGARSVSQDLIARVLVMRVPLSERPAGIGIEQLLADKRRAAR